MHRGLLVREPAAAQPRRPGRAPVQHLRSAHACRRRSRSLQLRDAGAHRPSHHGLWRRPAVTQLGVYRRYHRGLRALFLARHVRVSRAAQHRQRSGDLGDRRRAPCLQAGAGQPDRPCRSGAAGPDQPLPRSDAGTAVAARLELPHPLRAGRQDDDRLVCRADAARTACRLEWLSREPSASAPMSLNFLDRAIGLLKVADPPRWSSPSIVALGLLAAFLEGATLYLFIPLVQSLSAGSAAGDQIGHQFNDLLAPIPSDRRVAVLVVAVFAAVVLKNAVSFLNTYVTRLTGGHVAHRLRLRVFEQTISSCIDYRVQSKKTDIVNTLTTETWKVSSGLILVYRLVICACTCVVFLVLLLSISAPLTAIALLFLGVSAAMIHLATRRAASAGKSVVAENKRFGLRMWESINALPLIRSFSREDYELARFQALSESVHWRILKMDMLWAVPGPLSEVFATALIGLLILTGSLLGTGFAVLAAFLAVLWRMQGPVREIMSSKVALDTLGASVADVAEYLEATKFPYIKSGTRRLPRFDTAIEFRDVSFRYAPHEPLALDRVSFAIPMGRTTAIVGRSGAGKSTLMTLLYRFEDPTSGAILVDGTPLRELDTRDWRKRLSLMSQDVRLFNETVESNIAYGDLDATPEAIRKAAAVAGADAFIRGFPDGYATQIGDHGMRLSGGQRQRIALARTILRDPDILLLDEATNALDSESESAIQNALDTYARGRTVVVIAHRLATVADADQVIVLEGGRVVEIGPPATLLRSKGQFARLHGLQFGKMAMRG